MMAAWATIVTVEVAGLWIFFKVTLVGFTARVYVGVRE